jgi:hypothetical protein
MMTTLHTNEYGSKIILDDLGRLWVNGREVHVLDNDTRPWSCGFLYPTNLTYGLAGETIRHFRIQGTDIRLRHIRKGDDRWWDVLHLDPSR